MRSKVGLGVAASVMAISASGWAQQKTGNQAPALATIPGVTLQAVRLTKGVLVPGSNASQAIARTAFADATGRTLYTFDKDAPGKSACVGECTVAWPPLAASADSKPNGDWSVVMRDDGTYQWAFEGKPLYTSVKDKALGSSAGHDADGLWHAVLLQAPAEFLIPTEVAVEEVLTAPGLALVDAQRRPLYAFDSRAKDKSGLQDWQPVKASALAIGIGDFTVVKRGDGIIQWAFKGKPLYTYKWDVEPGDTNGKSVDKRFELAVVRSYFMPAGVTIRANQKRGGILVTADDHTLYARDRTQYTGNGQHNARGGARGNPAVGTLIGVTGCDAACEQTRRPLKAPADAQPSGYWSVLTRADGSKQWGYQGYALYSYTGEASGDVSGHDSYSLTINHDTRKLADASTGLGLFWRVSVP